MPKTVLYLDGKYVRVPAAVLETFTPGQGSRRGVFETLRTDAGRIEFLDEHVQRLIKGLKVLRIRHRLTSAALKRIARDVVGKNAPLKAGRLRLMVFQDGKAVHCAAMLMPYAAPSAQAYKKGWSLKIIKTQRPATARHADVKSLDYAMFAKAYTAARQEGYDDALLLNRRGQVFETSRANVFLFFSGRLVTPPLSSGCLNGVMRRQVIAAARALGIPVSEQAVSLRLLESSDGIFLTNSMVGIMPVAAFAW